MKGLTGLGVLNIIWKIKKQINEIPNQGHNIQEWKKNLFATEKRLEASYLQKRFAYPI